MLKKQIEVLGNSHTDTLSTKERTAFVLLAQDQVLTATKLFSEVYEVKKKLNLGSTLETLEVLFQLALGLYNQGRIPDALNSFKILWEGQKVLLGEKDLKTLDTREWCEYLEQRQKEDRRGSERLKRKAKK